MNGAGLARTAVTNSLRSMSRTILTVVAIFIGAFTLTLTTAVGNGINSYIDNTTSAIGSNTTLNLTKTPAQGDGPAKYDAGATVTTGGDQGPGGGTVETITAADLTKLRRVDGVVTAKPVLSITPDFVVYSDGRQYQLQAAGLTAGTTLQLVAGAQPDPASKTRQIALPESYVIPLEFTDAQDAIDKTVTVGVTDADGKKSTVTAKVVAIVRPGLGGSAAASTNEALSTALYDRQSVGLTTSQKQSYAAATVEFDAASTAADITTLRTRWPTTGTPPRRSTTRSVTSRP